MLGAGQHLDRAGGQAVGSLQQPDITVEVVAVHNKVHSRAVHELQIRGDLGVALVRNTEHGVQLARHRHIHDAALVQRVVLLILLAGHLDAVVHHHGAVAQDHAFLADPAHIALAGHSLTIRDLFQQALAGDHAGKELVQRRVRIAQHRSRIDNGGVNVLHLDGMDVPQRDAPLREELARRGLHNIDAAQLTDVPPAGDDRADLVGALLHHAGRYRRHQRTGQRRGQAEQAGHGRGRRGCAFGRDKREQEGRQTTAAQQPDKLLLVLIAGAVGGTVGQKAAEDLGRAGDEHAGMRLGQPLRDRAQGSGVLQAVGNGIAILPADALKGIADRGRVQGVARRVHAEHQRCRTGQHQRAVGVTAGGQNGQALHRSTQRR